MITTKVNEIIERFENQYFYSETVGTYLINLPHKTILFDLPSYSKEIENYLSSKTQPLEAILSHGSCGIADGSMWQKKLGIKVYLHRGDKEHAWLRMKPDVLFEEAPQLDERLEVIYTPGHSAGSICLLEMTTKTLFTGDTFGGAVDGTVRDFRAEDGRDDTSQRLMSCKKLYNYDFERALPFHYEMILSNAKSALVEFVKETEK